MPGCTQIAMQCERDLGLDLRLQHSAQRDFLAVVQFHVGEQHAEVRRVHAELRLYRLRCQADLATNQASSFPEAMLGIRLLYRVRCGHAAFGEVIANRSDRLAVLRCLAKPRGHGLNDTGVHMQMIRAQ